jgi:hypothetical protein
MAAPTELFQGLAHNDLAGDRQGALIDALITSYEQAIQDGLPPSDALSVILNWVAEEILRMHQEMLHSA